MKSAYGEDLAYIHDSAFSGFADTSAPWLLKTLRANRIRSGLVVDLGCGSGRWAAELCNAGYDVLGVDISPAMIRLARRNAPGAKFKIDSALRMPLPGCNAVTALGECFNYGFDRTNSFATLRRMFRRIHRALAPGGLFIFDVAGPGIAPGGSVLKSIEGKDWAILLETAEKPRALRAARRMTIFRRVGRNYRRTEEVHPLRLFPAQQMERALRDAGFQVTLVDRYGAMKMLPARHGFIAKKVD